MKHVSQPWRELLLVTPSSPPDIPPPCFPRVQGCHWMYSENSQANFIWGRWEICSTTAEMHGKTELQGKYIFFNVPSSEVTEMIRTRKVDVCQSRARTWGKGLVYRVLVYPKASDLFFHRGLSFPSEERKVLDRTHESQAFLPREQFLSPVFPCTAVKGGIEESCQYTGGI